MAIQTLGERLSDGATPIDPLAMEEALRKALSNEIATSEGVLQSEEAQKALSVRFTPVIDRQGTVVAALGVLAEATPGQANNQDTTESEAALREVINTMGDALVISDLQGRVREVNREFTHLTGYGRSEAQGTEFPYPWLLEEETPRFVQWISELREKRYLRDFDMTWRHKDGHETAISLSTTLFRNASGEPVAMLNIARDIGERRRLVTELATRSRQIEMLNRIISRANSTVDFAEIFETVSAEVGKILAFDEINVALLSEDRKSISIIARAGENIPSVHMGKMVPLDRTVSQLAVQRGEAVVVSNLPKHPELGTRVYSVQEGLKSQISIPIVLNNRILGTLNVASLEPEKFSDADLKILQPISDQIGAMIDRARLFQKVSDDSKYIHNLLNSIDSVVFTVDESYHVREVNHAWRQYAALKGFNQQTDESAAVGMNLESVIADPALWAELNQSMPKLFDGTMKIFSTEVVLGRDPWDRTFRLVVNPMTIGGKVIGLVFTYTDLTEIVRTKEEVNRRNEELVALNAISASITKTLNLEEVLDVAFTQVREMLKADTFLCFLEYGERGKLALARSFGIDTGTASGIQNLEIGKGSEALASAHEPFMVALGTSHDGDLVSALRALLGCIGKDEIIVLPLQSKERALGALLMTLPGGHARFEEQRRFLSLLGSQLGSAIENAQLYAEVQAQVQRITSLYELGRGLTGALDSKTLLELVHGEVSRSIPLRTFTYDEFLERPFALKAVFRALHNDTGEYIVEPVTDERVVEDGSPAKGVLTTGDPYLQTEGGLEPVMIVPVRSQQKVTGLITVTGAPGTVYTPTYLRLLESIANLTEIALDRVLLYEETIAKSREIEQRNRELDDFAYVVSHDLKEPLITIEGYSKIILGDHGDKLPDEGREHLASVVQSSGRMKNLIEDLLTLSRVGRSAEAPEFVSVKALLDDVLRDFVFTLEQRNAAVEIPERLPEVRYNATQLSMVFRNLISNAIKFNAQHRPQVTIGLKEKPDHFLFSVKDNGIGIAPEHYEKVFVIFQRLNRAEEYQGTGAGLTIVKRIIERHGGRIWVDSKVGEGTTFYFTVLR
jgi:PAS domain S-box-containing protein